MKDLIVLEFNEVSKTVLERMVGRGELPNFARLLRSHALVDTTVSESYEKLEPWIQWVTAHTGKSQAEHKAFNLSDVQHSRLRQVWDVLEGEGIACGLVSPMNARRGLLTKGFFIPDPWSVSDDAYPRGMDAIYRFVAQKVQSHNVGLEGGASKLAFLTQCLRAGVPIHVLGRLAFAYLKARLNPKRKWQLVAELDRFLFELALCFRKRFKTRYTSVFLNSVAHYQHHYWTSHDAAYWSKRFPRLFSQRNPVSERNLDRDDDPVAYGMRNFDAMLGQAIDAVGVDSVMVATGLSQVPFEGYQAGAGFYLYRPLDHERLLAALNVRFDRIAPLMSRDAMLYFESEAQRSVALAQIRSARVNGEPLFMCTEEEDLRVFFKVIYSFDAAEDALIEAEGVAPLRFHEHMLLITFKTGHHSPEGIVLAPKGCVAQQLDSPMSLHELPAMVFRAMHLDESEQRAQALRLSAV